MARKFLITCSIAAALAGCDADRPVDTQASNSAGLPDINATAPTATGEPHVATTPANSAAPAPAVKIPAALHGRWGLTPADCTSTKGDAKGLLIVSADKLQFYESRAVPTANVQADPSSMSGKFEFTGEGQTWTKYEALKADKQMLVRTEANPTASFAYAKCS